jgi:hypothetical protein
LGRIGTDFGLFLFFFDIKRLDLGPFQYSANLSVNQGFDVPYR